MRTQMLLLACLATAPLGATNFPMECGDLRRTNAVTATAMVAPLDLQWASHPCLYEPNTNPLIVNGHVIMHDRGRVLSMSLADGHQEWVWL
ncbi:MAG TPA: hypothetical protein VNZ67_15250, partial [bacterium]|nr:hypothetical protein [bacterium]